VGQEETPSLEEEEDDPTLSCLVVVDHPNPLSLLEEVLAATKKANINNCFLFILI
jgi:hypothetical protein